MLKLLYTFFLLVVVSCGGSKTTSSALNADPNDPLTQTCVQILTQVGYFDAIYSLQTCAQITRVCRSADILDQLGAKKAGQCMVAGVGLALIPSKNAGDSFQYCGTIPLSQNNAQNNAQTMLQNVSANSNAFSTNGFGGNRGALDWWISSFSQGQEIVPFQSASDAQNNASNAVNMLNFSSQSGALYPALGYGILTGCPLAIAQSNVNGPAPILPVFWANQVTAQELFYWQYMGAVNSRFACAQAGCHYDWGDAESHLDNNSVYCRDWGYYCHYSAGSHLEGGLNNSACFPGSYELGQPSTDPVLSQYVVSNNGICSSCGTGPACSSTQLCVNGTCTCPAGTVLCSNSCLNIQIDPNNCGSCGNVCPTVYAPGPFGGSYVQEACINGNCTSSS